MGSVSNDGGCLSVNMVHLSPSTTVISSRFSREITIFWASYVKEKFVGHFRRGRLLNMPHDCVLPFVFGRSDIFQHRQTESNNPISDLLPSKIKTRWLFRLTSSSHFCSNSFEYCLMYVVYGRLSCLTGHPNAKDTTRTRSV